MLDKLNTALIEHDSDYLREVSHPQIISDSFQEEIEAVFSFIPTEEFKERQSAGFQTTALSSVQEGSLTNYSATYQYEFEDSWLLVSLVVRREEGELFLAGLHVNPLQGDLRQINTFTVAGKSVLHWTILAACVLMPVISLFTLVSVIRMRRELRRPILWGIFVCLGFGSFTLNWTTGAYAWQILSFGLFSAGVVRTSDFMPWQLTVYLPLGAILFWTLKATGKLGTKAPKDQSDEKGDTDNRSIDNVP